MDKNILLTDTVNLDEARQALVIIDQTKLPNKIETLYLTELEDIHEAIYLLKVRGAPAIGVAAAIGVYLAARRINTQDTTDFTKKFQAAKNYLASARPTAVNLFWALGRMEKVVLENQAASVAELKELVRQEAVKIRNEDISVCRRLGEHALTLLKDGDGILTHCNAGQLATIRYGTALAPIHLGRERGMNFKVFCDETRPLLQGARLTAFELMAEGVDTTLICDNMVSAVMRQGWIQIVFVGCDRVAANGDTANKIGTSGVAILAKHYGVPFYVVAPTSTIDMKISCGAEIPIEQRKPEEVTDMWYKNRMAPEGVGVYNPAFDVTDNALITGFVTEHGIIRPPFDENFIKLFGQ